MGPHPKETQGLVVFSKLGLVTYVGRGAQRDLSLSLSPLSCVCLLLVIHDWLLTISLFFASLSLVFLKPVSPFPIILPMNYDKAKLIENFGSLCQYMYVYPHIRCTSLISMS